MMYMKAINNLEKKTMQQYEGKWQPETNNTMVCT